MHKFNIVHSVETSFYLFIHTLLKGTSQTNPEILCGCDVKSFSTPFFFPYKSTHTSEAGAWGVDNITFLFGKGMNKESEGKNNSQYLRKMDK